METKITDKPNYSIIVLTGPASYNKRVIEKFYAKDRDEAYKYLCDKYRSLNDGNTYYYDELHYYYVRHDDGALKEYEYDSLLNDKYKTKLSKWWHDFCFSIEYYFWMKPRDWWYDIKDFFYLMKHKIPKSATWNLDSYLLNTIVKVVPSILDKRVGISMMFIDMAATQLYGKDEGFNLEDFHNKYCSGYPNEVEELAMKIMKDKHMEIVYHIKLYDYLQGFGIINANNKDEIEFDKANRHLLPIYEGTYDDVDYVKLHELIDKEWNAIWDWMKVYGHTLWD